MRRQNAAWRRRQISRIGGKKKPYGVTAMTRRNGGGKSGKRRRGEGGK